MFFIALQKSELHWRVILLQIVWDWKNRTKAPIWLR